MTNTEYLSSIKEMIIDGNKENATCRLEQQTKERKPSEEYKEYRENKEQLQISKVLATGKIQNSYEKWFEVVERSVKMSQRNKIKQKLGLGEIKGS